VFTDRHTDTHTQTNVGENIFPRFCGDDNDIKAKEQAKDETATQNIE